MKASEGAATKGGRNQNSLSVKDEIAISAETVPKLPERE